MIFSLAVQARVGAYVPFWVNVTNIRSSSLPLASNEIIANDTSAYMADETTPYFLSALEVGVTEIIMIQKNPSLIG